MKNKKSIITKVEKGLKVALKNKMNSYKRETTYMPFMEGIFGKKNTAIYSYSPEIKTPSDINIYLLTEKSALLVV